MKLTIGKFGKLLPVALSLYVGAVAHAQVGLDPNWGTNAQTFNLNCISADCGGGGVSGGASGPGPTDDQVRNSPASSFLMNELGQSQVTADFTELAPGLQAMIVTGDSASSTDGISEGFGRTLALYTYAGPPTAVTVTLSIAPNATFSGPISGADNNIDGIEGTVYLFTDESDIIDINAFEEGANLFCLFECYIPDEELNVTLDAGISALADSVVLNLADGDQFYLFGSIGIASAGGGDANAGDGVTVSFSSTTGLTSIPAGSSIVDTDSDGVADDVDNCILAANADQRDTNGDGFGNACDPDFDNNGIVNFVDISNWIPLFNTACGDVDEDINGDGGCNFGDFAIITQYFNLPPGPSGIAP